MTTRFDRDTATESEGPGRFRTRIDRGWWVVKAPNGGYIAAIVLRALSAAVDDPSRAPRSLTIHYTAPPVEGPAHLETRVERQGRSLTTVSGRLMQDDRLIALTLGAFSKPRDGYRFSEAQMPEVAPPEQCEPLNGEFELRKRYEQRWALGSRPFEGGHEALAGGWIRLAEPRLVDALLAAAYTDAFPPAVFSAITTDTVRPGVPTIDLTIHFRAALPLADANPEDYSLAIFRSRLSREGFMEEDGEIWSRGGILLAQSRQLALIA